MAELKNVVANNISELRRESGMTQLELAEKMNYSDKAVSKWERGESIPDVSVLKNIAEMFGVTVDYLLKEDHSADEEHIEKTSRRKKRNRTIICGISILCVWLAATLAYVNFDIFTENKYGIWLAFIYAVPVSMIVWLVFNSLWFNIKRNFLIVSLLMWSGLAAAYLTFLLTDNSQWQIFLLGIPAQPIILLWSGIRIKHHKKK